MTLLYRIEYFDNNNYAYLYIFSLLTYNKK